ncbi:5' exonuclease Apollo [Gouania willdenowi]|uniref:5' exonuclease Apollo n=1 Tax=Gouania willdenowi TaxID=441366 RepID=A0A8C5NF43_GOUWI|nr:5' exonuclease Apollo [Gouania willdenowi]
MPVIPHTPLAVDFWQVRKSPGTRLFFLTHLHADHTTGLSSTWSNRPIYCSPVSASLLRLMLKVKDEWIHPLEVGDPHLLPLDDIGKERLTVTLIDANHCPGAVMFLFEGYFGSILYTGDFRYIPSMLREPCFRTHATIDVLYLDNTNCDPNRTLPSRQRATQQIKEIIRSRPNHNVVIGLYTLGKESLLVDLALEFKTWVEVSLERMEMLKLLEMPDVFTTEPGAGRIQVVTQSKICSAALSDWNKQQPTLAILPTSRPLVSFHPSIHVVPYSDHSSYQELEDFVSALRPTSLVPLVGNMLPGGLTALLPNKKRHEFLVPESVRRYMLSQPEEQLPSSAYVSLCYRNIQPLKPRGVIFDSPIRGSRESTGESLNPLQEEASEEDDYTESNNTDSDCIVMDLSQNIDEHTEEDEDRRRSPILSVMVPSCKTNLNSATTTKRPFEANAKISNHYHQRNGNAQRMVILDEEPATQHFMDNHVDLDLNSCPSPSSLTEQQYLELENELLKNLPVSEEDLNPQGVSLWSFLQRFPLIPKKKK